MEQIILQLKNTRKRRVLLNLLSELDFVEVISDGRKVAFANQALDATRSYRIPEGKLSVVKESEGAYIPKGQRTFTLDEVRSIVDAVREEFEFDLDDELSPKEIAELNKRDRDMDSGKVKSYTWDQVQRMLDGDRKKQRAGK